MVATKICVSLVETASEEKKLAAAESGILPALKIIIDDPPPPPESPFLGWGEIAPENVPLPDSPATPHKEGIADDTLATNTVNNTGVVTDVNASNGEQPEILEHPENLASPPGVETDSFTMSPAASELHYESESIPDSTAIQHHSSQELAVSALTPIKESDRSKTLDEQSNDHGGEPISTSLTDAAPAPAVSETPKVPKSPRKKGVTFDSVDKVIVVDTTLYADDDDELEGSEEIAGSPRLMREPPTLHESSDRSSEKSKLSSEAAARVEVKNKEEIYQQAYTAIDHIITDIPKDALDTVGEAYVAAGLHEPIIQALA